jgi:polysaccharide deacetylase 2 family uncharacterized protein YibQ
MKLFAATMTCMLCACAGSTTAIRTNADQAAADTVNVAPSETPANPTKAKPVLPDHTPVAAIVIDDCGESVEQIIPFIGIPLPLSFSVLPYQKGVKDTVSLLKKLGRDTLVHVPMEPHDPKWLENDWFLKCDMPENDIAARLDRALAAVPTAKGVNNHMGSKFCIDASGMTSVMQFLSGKGLYYLDSRTNSESKASATAATASVKFMQRDVFLDNDDNVEAILKQIELLEKTAKKNGCAVGIGHARSATAAAIMRYARDRDPGVVFVPAAEVFDYCPTGPDAGSDRSPLMQTGELQPADRQNQPE